MHFSGHGSPSSEIVLQNDTGTEFTVPPEALSNLFSQFSDNIHCVVLNACYSRTQAEAIAEHIDSVIGMDDTITDKAAIVFSSAFYQALGYGRSIQSAFNLACNQIQMKGLDEHGIPQLLSQNVNVDNIILQPIESHDEVTEIQVQIATTLFDALCNSHSFEFLGVCSHPFQ